MPKQGKVFRPMIVPDALVSFIESNGQNVAQLILDASMGAHGPQDAVSSGYAGGIIAVFATFRFTDLRRSADPGRSRQVLPVSKAL